ncbi:Proteolipid protein 2 [Friedmanniomyces endolithicus]|uniref:Proteolipid protein 2 n=1 Tax=Friedmanniomyces endolithicus TaxID=329885 RepID=A0AAN6F653_9PEZI|nr:Proteolipid protein 2 [Friedmanniomyces endolithicus]KAK0274026.1 Proteolipid protein 2 [Friedmanniomyces endolithicus]KAK0306298.1 Proteolipid protein 2 [Friedmanniomyces endolithicus]KAK0978192.1 Proteolipid protein 2 [Friedmanniomyces endolithicus]
MDMNMPVNVPVDDPNADTEWNDILRRHKIIPEKPPSPTPLIEEALTQARQLARENRLEGKDLEELDELEDDEDEAFLDSYRQKRMQEMKVLERRSVYGRVFPVQKVEYSREVTEESSKAWVCVLLTSSSGMNVESQRLVEVWRELAATWGEVKFCQMRADLCIEGYPDRNTPTVLIYQAGEIRRQIVTLKEVGGDRTSVGDVEAVLVGLGAIKHGDTRLAKKERDLDGNGEGKTGGSIRQSERRKRVDDEDGDSDLE